MSDNPTPPTTLYQNEVPAPIIKKERMNPVWITAACGVCEKGELRCQMDGGNAWLHSCTNCNVSQWHGQQFPRLAYEKVADNSTSPRVRQEREP